MIKVIGAILLLAMLLVIILAFLYTDNVPIQ